MKFVQEQKINSRSAVRSFRLTLNNRTHPLPLTTSPYETGGTSFANRSGTETHISAAAPRAAYAENEDNATGEIRLSFELWTGEWAGLRRRPLGQVVRRTEHGPFGCSAGRPRHRPVLVQHEADGDQAAQAAEVLGRRKQDKNADGEIGFWGQN